MTSELGGITGKIPGLVGSGTSRMTSTSKEVVEVQMPTSHEELEAQLKEQVATLSPEDQSAIRASQEELSKMSSKKQKEAIKSALAEMEKQDMSPAFLEGGGVQSAAETARTSKASKVKRAAALGAALMTGIGGAILYTLHKQTTQSSRFKAQMSDEADNALTVTGIVVGTIAGIACFCACCCKCLNNPKYNAEDAQQRQRPSIGSPPHLQTRGHYSQDLY